MKDRLKIPKRSPSSPRLSQRERFVRWYCKQPESVQGNILNGLIAGSIGALAVIGIWIAGGLPQAIYAVRSGSGSEEEREVDSRQPTSEQSQVGDSQVQLVDLSFVEPSLGPTGGYPQLDVKLRNTGGTVAFLKRVDIHVDKVWKLEWPSPNMAGGEISTWTYDLALPSDEQPFDRSYGLSQSLEANAVDRFTLTLGQEDEPGTTVTYVYLMTVEFVYDEDDKSVVSSPVLVASGTLANSWGISCDMFERSDPTEAATCRSRIQASTVKLREIQAIEAIQSPLLRMIMSDLHIDETTRQTLDPPA